MVSPQCTDSSHPLTFPLSSLPQGPNGAGKTTAISMLCGLFEPSDGNAYATELQAIHQTMGVCPQHDVLWSDLTAREHLLFYGRLKGEGWCDVGLPFDVLFSCSGLWFVVSGFHCLVVLLLLRLFLCFDWCFFGVLIGGCSNIASSFAPSSLLRFLCSYSVALQDWPARDWCRKSSQCWPM